MIRCKTCGVETLQYEQFNKYDDNFGFCYMCGLHKAAEKNKKYEEEHARAKIEAMAPILRRTIKKLQTEADKITEKHYSPGEAGYQKAKEHFELISKQ